MHQEKVIVRCPNKGCQEKLRLPKVNKVLAVSCPICGASFKYKFPSIIANGSGYQKEKSNMNSSDIFTEFGQAIEDEIKAVRTRGGTKSLPLKDGKIVGEITGEKVYQFHVERRVPVADETPAQVEISGKTYRASIVRFLEFKLEIRITGLDKEEIPSAYLKIDATYVLRKLKEALSSLKYYPSQVELPGKLFNLIPPKCGIENATFSLIDKNGKLLDSFQQTAVEACLGNEVSFIHGPPGTGKTRTLVNVVNELAQRGRKILVCSHTNIACDNVIEHFLRYEHERTVQDLLGRHAIVRVGTPTMQDEKVKSFTLDAICEHLNKRLENQKTELVSRASSLRDKKRTYKGYRQALLQGEKLGARIESCKQNISVGKGTIERYLSEEKRLYQLMRKKRKELSFAEKQSAVVNFFKRIRPKKIREEIARVENQRTQAVQNRCAEERRLKLLKEELEKLNVAFSKQLYHVPEHITREKIEHTLRETEEDLEVAETRIAEIKDSILTSKKKILNDARVVVSTLAKTCTDPVLMNMQFDDIVVDEASIAPLPMLFWASSLAKEKAIIFGDPKQLAPIKLARTPAANRWLKKDIFHQANAQNELGDSRIVSLNSQYRMHQHIFNLVNHYFYEGKLYNKREQHNKDRYDRLVPYPKHRFLIIDTSKANACVSTEKTGPRSRSRYNLYHTQVTEHLLHTFIDKGYLTQEEIGIITPYKSQASFAREMLLSSDFNTVDVGTVHSFQGIEKECIIFDLVEALGGKKIGILVNDQHEAYVSKEDENDALRLLTVAFSRAREKLLLIAHVRHMLNKLPEGSVIRNIIANLVKQGAVMDGSKLVPYYVSKDEYPDVSLFDEKELLAQEAILNQRNFYPYFIQDLKNAQKEVIIISGYMSTNRVQKLIPYFTKLLSKDVTIKIFTKPPREQMSRESELEDLHHHLKDMGIEIYQHYGTHEKVVTIDGHVLYEGSLNVLSFNSSKEMMVRTDSKGKLQKVLSVLAKNHPKLRNYLSDEYIVEEKPLDLTPDRFQNILDTVHPKHKKLPRNKEEAKEYYTSVFTKLRWVIADDKRIPNFAIFFRKTVESMLNNPPATKEQLLSLPEFRRNRTNIRGYEDVVLKILSEYRDIIGENDRL